MTIVMRGSPAGGDTSQEAQQPGANPATAPAAPATTPQPVTPTPQTGAAAQQGEENGQGDVNMEPGEDGEPEFPVQELARLDEMINRPRWVVPVLPNGELEVLLNASIKLCREGLDTRSEACQRFFREGLTVSFTKIMTDEAVSGWKYEIHKCILNNAAKMVELCVVKLSQDWFALLDLLAMVFHPQCKFHTYNGTRSSDTVPAGSTLPDDALFARPPDPRTPRGWLVDLVNKFGSLEGFQTLLDRFTNSSSLSVPVIAALVKPFGLCAEVLTPHTVQKYFMPIVEIVPKFLDGLTDEELKKESKTEAKNDALSSIIKALKQLVYRLPNQEDTIKSLEIFRLKMILRLLQISSFNGKMNALNEVNKVIANVSFHSSRHSQSEEDEWLTADKMAEWIQENDVLSIVLRDSLHQPQYVEKLEKILRFMIKEKALSLQNLDKLWEAQSGKHDAIVKNVHDLLAKLAWDFSPEQLDHLFECFQVSWAHASKKQREKLLELIRRLAEDDKEGIMAHKVLGLLWNLAHSEDVPTDIMDQALSAHIKILDYSCSQDRDAQKMSWITKFVEEIKNDKWVLPALKQIREICQLFPEAPQNFPHVPNRVSHVYYRNSVISVLQSNHAIVMAVAQNLSAYMTKARNYFKEHPNVDPGNILPDGRFNHIVQVQERLRFLRFLLKDGQLWLCESQARQIWHCLAENAIYATDREACFKWFAKLMGEEPDLDPEITREFFEKNILQFDATLLSENGMNCFERFFKHVNLKENKLIQKRRGGYMMEDLELVGYDYLWRVVMLAPEDVAEKAIVLLKDTFTNLGPRLQQSQIEIHEDFIQTTMDRLKALFDTVSILEEDKESTKSMMQETTRMIRVLTVLKEYVNECDELFGEERSILPLSRACRGKLVTLVVRFPNQGRQVDDIEIWSHTNETIGAVRRHILHRVKANTNVKVDLYVNGEILEPGEDKRLISQIPLRDKMLITAKLVHVGNSMPSSPDSSSDSSGGSPHHTFDGPNVEAENCLPGVLMSNNQRYAQFLFQLSDLGCSLQVPKLRDTGRTLLKLMPADTSSKEKFRTICSEHVRSGTGISQQLEAMFFNTSPTQVLYNIEVAYSLLMPSQDPMAEDAFEFQYNFIRSGGVQLALNMMTKNNFLPNADLSTRRLAYVSVLKMCKLMLTVVGYAKLQVVVDACSNEPRGPPITSAEHSHAVILQQALHHIPNHTTEFTTRNVAIRLGQQLAEQATSVVPDLNTIKAIQKIAWSSGSGSLHLVHASNDEIHKAHEKVMSQDITPDPDDLSVAREAMEVLTVCMLLCPSATEALHKDKAWQLFIIDNLLHCRNKPVRQSSSEQFFLMATKCSSSHRPVVFFITLLFTVLSMPTLETIAKMNRNAPYKSPIAVKICGKSDIDNYTNEQGQEKQRVIIGVCDQTRAMKAVLYDMAKLPSLKDGKCVMLVNVITKNSPVPALIITKQSRILMTSVIEASEELINEGKLIANPPPAAEVQIRDIQSLPHKMMVSIRGYISAEEMVRTVSVKGKDTNVRTVKVRDDQGAVCKVSLWRHLSAKETKIGCAVKIINVAVHQYNEEKSLNSTSTTKIENLAKDNAKQASEYFQLLCRLLNYACSTDVHLPNAEVLLNNEITWLKRVRDQVLTTGESHVEETLLEGHLGITRELLSFQSAEKKFQMGSQQGGANLIKELVEDFVFPASKIVLQSRKLNGEFPTDQATPVCTSPATVIAAYDLLVALCTGCVPNLRSLAAMLIDMYYSGDVSLQEWEYLPPVGARPHKGFVGLKNAGATCYMNSVLQQLFMIEPIRLGSMSVEGAADDVEEDYSSMEKGEGETNVDMAEEERKDEEKPVSNRDEERKEYNLGILKQIQLIFGNLYASKLQYYVPRGFWKHFKLWGEPVNLREQHDALEFFNSLVDSVDEALKVLGQPTILQKELGGSFADQKICKDCPHRYQREEPFTSLNVDIRNHHNLFESLEQYVKGDLLEGANAYHCDKCNKKVDTVKRLVIRKLPKILAIQLKRFDYDWERESAIKFNDYFEFSREFDMEPYTVQGLAKIEGEIIDADCDEKGQSTKYKLIGVVVHSGQASGGHYYSYILHKGEGTPKWYKFDDGDVSECKMDDDEEMKNQCFGGEYMGEVFDHMLKRMTYRRQKRWWNAYILFYERVDDAEEEKISKTIQDLSISNPKPKMPKTIEKCVRKQNIMFMHEKTQFSPEYFQFMKRLLTCNQIYTHTSSTQDKLSQEAEHLAMLSTELASKFLFTVGFHTKKSLRGSATEWYEALTCNLRSSKKVRMWFAQNVMFSQPGRFAEYLLECPSSEVRNAFCKVVVCLAHFSLNDGVCPPPLLQGLYAGHSADPNATLSDHLLMAVLNLLKKEVSEHGRHLQQYFHLFLMYSNLGVAEKMHLLKLNVPALFMMVALDEGPGPPIKYQYAELSKLYSVVSQLVRCCDVSSKCNSSVQNQEPSANPYGDQILMPIQTQVAEILISRTSYVKKLLEDCNNSEDTTKLLRYCCWENPHFSSTVLSELLWQVAYSYTYELRPYLDLLLQMLLLEDSWQNHRIHNALKGIPDDRDGLLDTIQRSKSHYQKRAYQCIKMMVALFMHCPPAQQMLLSNSDLKRRWTMAVEWLNDELERRPYPGNAQYTYNNWSPPAQSNETSNGYFLERSQSARVTLAKAIELCPDPEEDQEDADLTDDQEGSHLDDSQQGVSQEDSERSQGQRSADGRQMQNNQVTVEKSQPVQPNNQINNQLNTPSTSEQQSTTAETGEEEEKKESKVVTEESDKVEKPAKSSQDSTKADQEPGSSKSAPDAGTSKSAPDAGTSKSAPESSTKSTNKEPKTVNKDKGKPV